MTRSPELAAAIRDFGTEIARIRREIDQVKASQRSPQLDLSSIENGSLTINDGDGNPQIQLGLQQDGTFAHVAVAATSQEAPSDPVVAAGIGGVYVIWDGQMADGSQPLSDFDRLQVHVSPMAGFTPDATTIAGYLDHPGMLAVGSLSPGITYYTVLVPVSTSQEPGIPSGQIAAIPTAVPDNIDPGSLTGTMLGPGTVTGGNIAEGTITADEIAAQTIAAVNLAAGIIVAGIVDATTITGAHFVATGTAGEYLAYSGTPAAGNLIMAFSPSGDTDSFGNAYLAGLYVAQAAPLTDFVEINNGQITLGNGAGTNATIFGFGGELNLNSGKTATPGDTAANIVLYSADTGSRAQVIISPAGASPAPVTGALLEVQGQMTATSAAVSGVVAVSGVIEVNGGSDTSGDATVRTPGFVNGTAAQLADITHDYMVYLQIGTPGTAFSLKIGASNPPGNNIYVSATPPAGMLISFRLPAGWWVQWAGTSTTLAMQRAVGC